MQRLSKSMILLAVGMALWEWATWSEAPSPPIAATLTLADARALALQNNPGLKSADAEWRAALGAAREARSLLNPSIGVRREDFGGSSPPIERAEQDTLELSQTFRTGGKRSAEIDAAGWASEVSRQDLDRRRLDLLSEVDRHFTELLGACGKNSSCGSVPFLEVQLA
jgi:outer membrane protein TolC